MKFAEKEKSVVKSKQIRSGKFAYELVEVLILGLYEVCFRVVVVQRLCVSPRLAVLI